MATLRPHVEAAWDAAAEGAEAAFAWMESQMFGDDPEPIH